MSQRRKILVTGGAGSIGRHLLPYLLQSADVVSLDLEPVDLPARSVVGSVTEPEVVLAAAEGVDAVLHMAYEDRDFDDLAKQIDVDLKGTVNVLEACVARSIPRVVFASTVMTVWGVPEEPPTAPAYHNFEPVNFYSYTKCCQELLAEMYTRQHELSAICLRIGGPADVTESPTRIGPEVNVRREADIRIALEDLCEAFRLALLECPDIKYATHFLAGDYGENHYFVDDLKKALGLQFRWRTKRDPETNGAVVFERFETDEKRRRGLQGNKLE